MHKLVQVKNHPSFIENEDDELTDGYNEFVAELEKDLFGSSNNIPGVTLPKKPNAPYHRYLINYKFRFLAERASSVNRENSNLSQ